MLKTANRVFLACTLACILVAAILPMGTMAYADDEAQYSVTAATEAVENFTLALLEKDDRYGAFEGSEAVYQYPLYDASLSEIIALLYELKTDRTVGYMIINPYSNVVLEFAATNENPYSKIPSAASIGNMEDSKRVYTYSDYGISTGTDSVRFLLGGEQTVAAQLARNIQVAGTGASAAVSALPAAATRAVSGFTYYLQNTRNCVAAAMAHVITFWNQSCPSLCNVTNQSSFNSLMDTLTTYGSNYGGIGVNANIPSVYRAYVNGLNLDPLPGGIEYSYNVTAQNIWNPTVSQVIAEINAGRPVMLGYTVWTTGPHMTVCTGIEYRSGSYYVTVASGHSTTPTERVWDSSVNDFICKVSFSVNSTRSIQDASED